MKVERMRMLGTAPQRSASHIRRRMRRPGFSFTEILFAVMILGIGFIMVAAMFPVAIKQTEEAVEDVKAATLAQAAERVLSAIAANGLVPQSLPNPSGGTGTFSSTNYQVPPTAPWSTEIIPPTYPASYTTPPVYPPAAAVPYAAVATQNDNALASFWQFCSGNSISVVDPSFAWVAVYSRPFTAPPTPFAQVTIFSLFDRNTPYFVSAGQAPGANDLAAMTNSITGRGANIYANLQARYAIAYFWSSGAATQPDMIGFVSDDATISPPSPPVNVYTKPQQTAILNGITEGTYLIVADDTQVVNYYALHSSVTPSNTPYLSSVGYCYRVGAAVSTIPTGVNIPPSTAGHVFQLMPGGDTKGQRSAPVVPASSSPPPVRVLVIGRGWQDPAADPTYQTDVAGLPMDLAVFTTIIPTRH